MRQIRFSKRHRPAAELDPLPLDPLPPDPRDPDIVRAKELARRQSRPANSPAFVCPLTSRKHRSVPL
jgi:hypothetical protein